MRHGETRTGQPEVRCECSVQGHRQSRVRGVTCNPHSNKDIYRSLSLVHTEPHLAAGDKHTISVKHTVVPQLKSTSTSKYLLLYLSLIML